MRNDTHSTMQCKIRLLSIWIATVLLRAAYLFHILALDLEHNLPGFSIAREERQLNGETSFSFYFFFWLNKVPNSFTRISMTIMSHQIPKVLYPQPMWTPCQHPPHCSQSTSFPLNYQVSPACPS